MKHTLKNIMLTVPVSMMLLTGCQSISQTPSSDQLADNKAVVEKVMQGVFADFDVETVKPLLTEDYIQHNPAVPTGRMPLLGFIPALKDMGISYKTHRIIADGDFVITHNTYDNAYAFGTKEIVTFDMWRVIDGQLTEHWDAIQPVVTQTASGRSQVDGPTEITDRDLTEANKTLVKGMVEDVLMGKNPSKITEYISTEQYHQHNPMIKDGLQGLSEAIQFLQQNNNMFVYEKVHRILGEGNFVVAISEGTWNGEKQAFYDLFRVDNGKIVEHWDIVQAIPTQSAHNNGMFGQLAEYP